MNSYVNLVSDSVPNKRPIVSEQFDSCSYTNASWMKICGGPSRKIIIAKRLDVDLRDPFLRNRSVSQMFRPASSET